MGGSKKVTTGYRYTMGLFMGICHECDSLLEVIAADKTAWAGNATDRVIVPINQPDLFGGDDKEGGLVGSLDIMMGRADQEPNGFLEQWLGSPQPAYRGLTTLVYGGQVAANNPYIKAWSVRVRSILAGWADDTPWYPEKAPIPYQGINLDQVNWRYKMVPRDDATSYANPAYDDSSWDTGYLPFASFHDPSAGYWTGVASHGFATSPGTEVGQNKNVWLRAEVGIADIGQVLGYEAWKDNQMALYINGHLVIDRTDTYGGFVSGTIANAYLVPGLNSIAIMARDNESTPSSGNWFYIGVRLTVPSAAHFAMNPAHIIYDALTNPEWGMGYPAGTIDDASFRAAADLFYAEGMGLCFNWNNQTTIKDFCQIVADHASLAFGQDRHTGLFRMLPLRDNYDVDSLPVFTSKDVRVVSYQRPSLADTVNEIIVQYTDIVTGNEAATQPIHNLGNIQGQGRVVSQTLSFPGIPTHELATRVAMRELIARSAPLWKFQLEFQRGKATSMLAGDPFVLDLLDTEIGVRLVLRAGEMDYGNTTDGVIRTPAVEDVFAMPAATYVASPGGYAPLPSGEPLPAEAAVAFEVPYVEVVRQVSDADRAAMAASSCLAGALAVRQNGGQQNYNLRTRIAPDDFAAVTSADFTPSCVSTADLAAGETAFTFDPDTAMDLDQVTPGTGAMLGSGASAEIVTVDAIDAAAGTATLGRGCADTVTAPLWPAGTRLWFYEEADGIDPTQYTNGDQVDMKVTPRAPDGELPVASASSFSVTMARRRQRPYPPGKLRIAGAAYPATVSGSFTVTWAHRNRDTQADTLVDETASSVTPAPNTRYALRFLDADNNLLVERTAIGPGTATVVLNYTGDVTLELYTIDDDSTSWQKHRWTFAYTPPTGTMVTAITATDYTPVYDGIIVDGGA